MRPHLALAGLLLAVPSLAQHQWLPLGTLLSSDEYSSGCSSDNHPFELGFPFTMPGGAVTTGIRADMAGSVVADDGTAPCLTPYPPVALMNSGAARIFAFSTPFEFGSQDAGVFAYTDGATVAAVTWSTVDVDNPSFYPASTAQLQLFADGRIVMLFDSLCHYDSSFRLGVVPGGNTPLPASTNFASATAGGPLVVSDQAVYQHSTAINPVPHPHAGAALEFAPTGPGGASGWTVTEFPGLPDPSFARNYYEASTGCFRKWSFTFAPDGVGGYDVTAGPSQYESNVGAPAGVSTSLFMATNFDLGFPMLFPDGNTYQFVDLDPNGRIIPAGLYTSTYALDPNSFAIEGAGYPFFFGLWSDWDPTDPAADDIYLKTSPGRATFTWRDVPQDWSTGNGVGAFQPCTWQMTLLQGGTVIVSFEDLRGLNPSIQGLNGVGGTLFLPDTACGVTSGQPHAFGEIDLTTMTGTPTNVPGYAYEYWNSASNPAAGWTPSEHVDLVFETGDLFGLSAPLLGGDWEMQLRDVGPAAFGLYVIGTNGANSSLRPLGSPCVRRVALDLVQLELADGLGNLQPLSLPLPATPALVGAQLFAQGVVPEPIGGSFGSFLGLPFGTSWTNAMRGTLGY